MSLNIHKTYTIEDLITEGQGDIVTYTKFSLLEKIGDITIPTENIIFDYMDEIKEAAVTVRLTDTEFHKYKYKPKLLAFDVYGTTESYFIIMALNNIIDVRDFRSKRLKMLRKGTMSEIVSRIYSANTNMIKANRQNIRE